jgi:hypothetical protein
MSVKSALHSVIDTIGDVPDHIKDALHAEVDVPDVPDTVPDVDSPKGEE